MSNVKPEVSFAQKCAHAINSLSFNPEVFVKAMAREHRTLQQNFTRVCLFWIQHVADTPEGAYDLRNEASVKTCRKIVEKVGKNELYLPLI